MIPSHPRKSVRIRKISKGPCSDCAQIITHQHFLDQLRSVEVIYHLYRICTVGITWVM